MPKQEVEYKDNRPEFKRRLAEDLKLPEGEIAEAITEATAFCMERGYVEMEALIDKYADLVCPWCGYLHYKADCQRQREEYHPKLKR